VAKAKEYLDRGKQKLVEERKKTQAAEEEAERLREIQAVNKKVILTLRADLAAEKQAFEAERKSKEVLETQVRELRLAALSSGKPAKGLCSFIFCRSASTCEVPVFLQQQANSFQPQWNALYPTNTLTYGVSGAGAYGEPTFGSMARICHVISFELRQQKKPLKSGDILLDWGCGAGKWLIFARQLLGVQEMVALGIEQEQRIFDICKRNLVEAQILGVNRANVLHAQSQSFASFCPVRVFLNYDGGTQKMQCTIKARIHRTIFRAAFCSPTVDVVVSSRLNVDTFRKYFSNHLEKFRGSLWKCLYVPRCYFGGSRFNTNVWFRLTPMQSCHNIVDSRMQDLLAGVFLSVLKTPILC
jgi:hypothetical protein